MKIISGGQTGADQGALEAAKDMGLETGGWMPKGWLTEEGPIPEMAELYGMDECQLGTCQRTRYRLRSQENVKDSDGTICFDLISSQATRNTSVDCLKLKKPFLLITLYRDGRNIAVARGTMHAENPENLARWIERHQIKTLNVAGNRESCALGIQEFVRNYMKEVIGIMTQVEA